MFYFKDFDILFNLEGIRKKERLRIFRKLEILISSYYRQLREWGLTRVTDASGMYSGGEQTERKDKREKKSYNNKQY